MNILATIRRGGGALLALLLCSLLLSGAASAKKTVRDKAPSAKGIAALLSAMRVQPHEQQFGTAAKRGKNLYGEVAPTTKPSWPGTKKPKRMHNFWTVKVARRAEPDAGVALDTGVRRALDLTKAMTEREQRGGGLIVVFIDPNAAGGVEAFATLVAGTGRTVTAVDCRGMNLSEDVRGPEMDCKETFAKWGMPQRP